MRRPAGGRDMVWVPLWKPLTAMFRVSVCEREPWSAHGRVQQKCHAAQRSEQPMVTTISTVPTAQPSPRANRARVQALRLRINGSTKDIPSPEQAQLSPTGLVSSARKLLSDLQSPRRGLSALPFYHARGGTSMVSTDSPSADTPHGTIPSGGILGEVEQPSSAPSSASSLANSVKDFEHAEEQVEKDAVYPENPLSIAMIVKFAAMLY